MKNNIKIISVIIVSLLLTTINIFGFNKQARTNYVIADTVDRGISFNPNLNYGTVTDIDGNVYKTVTIGTQVWMAENLKTTRYRNGDSIGTTTLNISAESSPKYQWASAGNESLVAIYGRLYTWYAATDSRNVCPIGWHVPSDAEWTTLTTYLGGEDIAGGKLKETGTSHWKSPNLGATNTSGFTALPGTSRSLNGTFNFIGETGFWWSSSLDAWYRIMHYGTSSVYRQTLINTLGFSVRCVKDK